MNKKIIIASLVIGIIIGVSSFLGSDCVGGGIYCHGYLSYLLLPSLFFTGYPLVVINADFALSLFGTIMSIPALVLIATIEVFIVLSLVSFVAKLIKGGRDQVQNNQP